MRIEKTGKPGKILTENNTCVVILRGKKVNRAEFHCVRRMLVDIGKYPPVIKSHCIYKGIQPCGSLVLQLFKMGVIVGEETQAQEH